MPKVAGTQGIGQELHMAKQDYTPHQEKIIRRYYDNNDTIQLQRLADLVGELYLSEGKKKAKVWESVASAMVRLGVPQSRIDHLVQLGDPAQVAQVVKEWERRPG